MILQNSGLFSVPIVSNVWLFFLQGARSSCKGNLTTISSKSNIFDKESYISFCFMIFPPEYFLLLNTKSILLQNNFAENRSTPEYHIYFLDTIDLNIYLPISAFILSIRNKRNFCAAYYSARYCSQISSNYIHLLGQYTSLCGYSVSEWKRTMVPLFSP